MNDVNVSIIMSTLNTKKDFLNMAIESILNQTFKDFELIIVNDGGNDKEIINEYKDNRIIVVDHKEKMGLPYSLNEAISLSKGKYIARMDSDDISLLNRLSIQVKYMEKHKDISMCSMFYKKIDNESEYIFDIWNSPEEVKCQLFFTNVIAHPCVMFRKSFLEENKLKYSIDYPYSQDLELWTRCAKYGKIKVIPKLGLYYRMHSQQISTNKKNMQNELFESVLIRNLNELGIESSNLKYLKMLNGKLKQIEIFELSNFVDEAIAKNNLYKIYNEKIFKKILYNNFFIQVLKSRKLKIELLKNKKIRNKIFKNYNFIYIIKKIYYILFIQFFNNKYTIKKYQ